MDRTNTQARLGCLKEPIFICAGEVSGDLYAGLLVQELRKLNCNSKIYGIGGDEMRKSGVEVVLDYQSLMTFGFTQGLGSLFRNYRIYQQIARILYQIRPQMYIAVAYPGLNLLLCRYAKKLGCQVYYYLPPQIWAWGDFRKYFVKKWVDKVITVFPFEYEYYINKGVNTVYLENPLIEHLKKYQRTDSTKRIGLMPGSRLGQIRRHLSIMFELMKKVSVTKHDIEYALILPPDALTSDSSGFEHWNLEFRDCFGFRISKLGFRHRERTSDRGFKLVTDDRYQAMKNCDLLITSSGTASFEAVIMNIPQVFLNRPSFFDNYLFKRFLKIKEYNLANLYFNKKIVPSFVSFNKNYLRQNVYMLMDNYVRDF